MKVNTSGDGSEGLELLVVGLKMGFTLPLDSGDQPEPT